MASFFLREVSTHPLHEAQGFHGLGAILLPSDHLGAPFGILNPKKFRPSGFPTSAHSVLSAWSALVHSVLQGKLRFYFLRDVLSKVTGMDQVLPLLSASQLCFNCCDDFLPAMWDPRRHGLLFIDGIFPPSTLAVLCKVFDGSLLHE